MTSNIVVDNPHPILQCHTASQQLSMRTVRLTLDSQLLACSVGCIHLNANNDAVDAVEKLLRMCYGKFRIAQNLKGVWHSLVKKSLSTDLCGWLLQGVHDVLWRWSEHVTDRHGVACREAWAQYIGSNAT